MAAITYAVILILACSMLHVDATCDKTATIKQFAEKNATVYKGDIKDVEGFTLKYFLVNEDFLLAKDVRKLELTIFPSTSINSWTALYTTDVKNTVITMEQVMTKDYTITKKTMPEIPGTIELLTFIVGTSGKTAIDISCNLNAKQDVFFGVFSLDPDYNEVEVTDSIKILKSVFSNKKYKVLN